jgi:hypothetical protein
MISTGSKLTGLACKLTIKANKAYQLTYLFKNIRLDDRIQSEKYEI